MSQLPAIEKFTTRGGVTIYRLPMMVFPGFIGYSYLLLNAGVPKVIQLIRAQQINDHLVAGIRAVADEFGETLTVKDIKHILITHGHIDHFGGTAFMIEQTGALVGIHELDRRVLTAYEERVIMATKDLRVYLERAGMGDAERTAMMEMYGFAKKNIRSVKVDFSLDEDVFFEGMQFIHVPGHCPGQVAILIDEVLLSADHILSRTTPHQAPESITHYTGLGHYKDSLRKIEKVDGIELALGGHEDPIRNFYDRVRDIRASHERKLNRVLDIIKNAGHPVTIREVTHRMYPDKKGYDTLLALEEAGAHIEYLYQHGIISVTNLHQVEDEDNPALQYVAS